MTVLMSDEHRVTFIFYADIFVKEKNHLVSSDISMPYLHLANLD
jgi:hypothetical protein